MIPAKDLYGIKGQRPLDAVGNLLPAVCYQILLYSFRREREREREVGREREREKGGRGGVWGRGGIHKMI